MTEGEIDHKDDEDSWIYLSHKERQLLQEKINEIYKIRLEHILKGRK